MAFIGGALLMAGIASAQTPTVVGAGGSITGGINQVGGIIDLFTKSIVVRLIYLFTTLGMAAFFFGLVQFIWASREGDSTKMTNGKNFMLWSMVALFVMFSIWGIVNYAQTLFGVTSNNIIVPKVIIDGQAVGGGTNPSGLQVGANSSAPTVQMWSCNGVAYSTQAAAQQACANSTTQPTPPSSTGGASSVSGGAVGADCTSNGECGSGLICKNFTCQSSNTSTTGSGGSGADCTSNNECSAGLTCQNFTCK